MRVWTSIRHTAQALFAPRAKIQTAGQLLTALKEAKHLLRCAEDRRHERTEQAAAEERHRIGQDLHDELGQQVSAIAMQMKGKQDRSADDEPIAARNELHERAVETARKVRRISHLLMDHHADNS